MIIDGKKIAEDIYARLRERVETLPCAPKLSIITCAPNFETKRYLALKQKKAQSIGVAIDVIELSPESSTEDFIACIQKVTQSSDGVIVQFPLPLTVDSDAIVKGIPFTHDVDGLNPENHEALTPVVDAFKTILEQNGVSVKEKFVTVIGSGRLVGLPAYHWFVGQGAHVSVVTRDTQDLTQYTKGADIIVCGAGVPALLTPSMIKDGVVILDAGTSEEGGELRGDADPSCAEKASLFTPVPGGIGPITIAVLLSNVVTCAEQKLV